MLSSARSTVQHWAVAPRLQRLALVALGCNGLRGMVRLRNERLPGRPLGIGWPWGRRSELALWGTAVSAPLALDAAMFAVAVLPAARAHIVHRMAGLLGGCVVAGQLVEPVVYRMGREGRSVRVVVYLNVGLGLLLVLTCRRADASSPTSFRG